MQAMDVEVEAISPKGLVEQSAFVDKGHGIMSLESMSLWQRFYSMLRKGQ